MMRFLILRPLFLGVAVLFFSLASGCITETRTSSPHPGKVIQANEIETPVPAAEPTRDRPRLAGAAKSTHVRSVIKPLGNVPYDQETLPLVSPNGRHVATQTGVPATWPTVLASSNASRPEATKIEIYHIDPQKEEATHTVTIDEGLVLGRSCDSDGFLIESPRPNGSRWIGRVGWTTGGIDWLIDDHKVNAFASIGYGGRLAWSSREVGQRTFDLNVRIPGDEWTIVSSGESWLLPTWSGDGTILYAMRLSRPGEDVGRRLDAAAMIATSAASMRQSLRTTNLLAPGNARQAYQALAPQGGAVGVVSPPDNAFVFVHPKRRRVAVWAPHAWRDQQPTLLEADSFAAGFTENRYALLALPEDLIRQDTDNLKSATSLLKGVFIPRAVRNQAWSHQLLTPTSEGSIAITAMGLLPVDEG